MKLAIPLVMALCLTIVLSATPAHALTTLTGCQEITVPDTYELNGNLFVDAGTDPTILTYGACLYSSTNIPITIEGNGFLLDASNTSGTEVAIRFSNTNNDATINNIRVGDNWDYSIDAVNNINIDITNNDLDAPINLQHSGIANILNNDIDSDDLAILHESNGAEETYIDNNNLTCTNIVSGNGGCIDTVFYGTAITYSVTNNRIENYAVPFGYSYYYDFAGGNILNYIFDNNYVYERLISSSLSLFGGGTLSIDGNTWTNEGADGFSETCTNDGTGYCVEQYEVFPTIFATNTIALTALPCSPNWVCSSYTPYGACQLDDTQNASCNGVTDTNACGESYTGDYSEFPDIQQGCDYCTPDWSCDAYGTYGSCQPENARYSSCISAVDNNTCYAQTGLPSDQYSGDYSEFTPEQMVCDFNAEVDAYSMTGGNTATLFGLYGAEVTPTRNLTLWSVTMKRETHPSNAGVNNVILVQDSNGTQIGQGYASPVVAGQYMEVVLESPLLLEKAQSYRIVTCGQIGTPYSPTCQYASTTNKTNTTPLDTAPYYSISGWGDDNVHIYGLTFTPTSCPTSWTCDGYETEVCLTDDTTTASCNSAYDLNACGETYTGNYSEFANLTGVCDYCTPTWSCNGYVNTSCEVVNGTGTLTQLCNSAEDSNGCYAQTLLPSDQYLGNYNEFGSQELACALTVSQQANYGQQVLFALLPLILICGSCMVYLGLNWKGRKDTPNNAMRVLATVVLVIAILLLIALL